MIHIALAHPQIPPNTGNIIRLCANTGFQLHLIHPLGFVWDDKRLKRAGLDYHEFANVKQHKTFDVFLTQLPGRLFAIETCGKKHYDEVSFEENDTLLFGSETRGLTQPMLDKIAEKNILLIPMRPNNRSLNLSNSVAIVAYEAWRQLKFN